jgi:hypothetical protein
MLFDWIAAHWEILTGVVVFAGIVAAAVFYLRAQNKQTINATQGETIDAQKRLLETRTTERDDFETQCKTENEKHEQTKAELAALRSEFKIIGAIVLDELIAYWSRRTEVMAELAATKSELEIARLTIARLQTQRADGTGLGFGHYDAATVYSFRRRRSGDARQNTRLCRSFGWSAEYVGDADELVRRVMQSQTDRGPAFDAIVCDIGATDPGTPSNVAAIRALRAAFPDLPVVFVTSYSGYWIKDEIATSGRNSLPNRRTSNNYLNAFRIWLNGIVPQCRRRKSSNAVGRALTIRITVAGEPIAKLKFPLVSGRPRPTFAE